MDEKQKAVLVEVKIDQRALERDLEKMVRSAVEDLRDEYEGALDEADEALDYHDVVTRTTLADLLGFDQEKTTPTWDKVFSAVEDLMAVRRG